MTTRLDQLKEPENFESEDGKLFLVRCVACKRENYGPAVASGTCSWCGWSEDGNKEAA